MTNSEQLKALLKNDREVNEPKISIIIPIYNAEKYLRNTLAHLMFQSFYEKNPVCTAFYFTLCPEPVFL